MSPWSFCCLQYYWSFYSSSSPLLLVWFWWLSYFLAYFLYIISQLCYFYQFYFLAHSPRHQGVSQGSVLGPLLFILYSTPLSSLISDSSVGHHLFSDDTQLFISFRAPEFSANILHLENKIDLVSQWMSANLLSLNQSKTEFLLIGLPAQLSEVSDPSLLSSNAFKCHYYSGSSCS